MLIVAWSPSGSLAAFFDADVFRSVLSIFITSAFLNLLQGTGVISPCTYFFGVWGWMFTKMEVLYLYNYLKLLYWVLMQLRSKIAFISCLNAIIWG